MNKINYTVQDLISNQSFRRMVKGTAGDEEIDRWNTWIEESERNRKVARDAVAEIAGFTFDEPGDVNVDCEWKRLQQGILKGNADKGGIKGESASTLHWIYRVAAVLILGVSIGAGFYMYSPLDKASTYLAEITHEKTVKTKSGEQKTISFSNGSKIILNSNSAVTYSVNDNEAKAMISAFVEGEAFFDAEGNTKQKQSVFAVKTPDGVIRDIGTEFLVSVEKDRSRVVLQEGRVEVNTKNKKSAEKNISVSDGEMLEFNRTKVLKKEKVNPTFYTSWATGSMRFDQTTIEDFAAFIEQRFNVEVEIIDPELSDIKIDGGIYYRSFEELVRSVLEVADIPVYQSRDTVYIGKNDNQN